MHKLHWILWISIFLSMSASGRENLRDLLDDFSGLRHAGNSPRDSLCNGNCDSLYETSTIYSPVNKKTITLSVVTEEKAKDIFNTLKNDEDNSFNFSIEGCFARAHKMAMEMDDIGVLSGKIFLEGEFPIRQKNFEEVWAYHTASLLMVRKKGKPTLMVMDPTLFDRPVTPEEWKKKITRSPKAKVTREFYTKRFIFNRNDLNSDANAYDENDTEAMHAYLKNFSREAYLDELTSKKDQSKKDKK